MAQAKLALTEELNGKVESIYPPTPTKAQRPLWVEAAKAVSRWLSRGTGPGILITGSAGRGKSELLKAIAWMMVASAKVVKWERPSLQAGKAEWEKAHAIEELLEGDVILFADVNTADEAKYVRTVILNAADAGKFVGIATNLTEEALYELLGSDIRVNSRQAGWTRIVMGLELPDLRKGK